MAKCAYCGTGIFLGGKRDGTLAYCNKFCQREAYLAAASRSVSPEVIQQTVQSWHSGPCPKCHGPGLVDVYLSHRIHSMLVLTQWQSFSHISCRACARKKQMGHAVYSFFLGWWGIPWGIILTPVQIGRNITALVKNHPSGSPSPALEKSVRRALGAQVLANEKASGIPPRQV